MNRRKAIGSILLLGSAAYGGKHLYRFFRTPDLGTLPAQKALIAELAEMIIPRTDTPGAKDAAVEDFIILMIKDCTPRKQQNSFLQGLDDVAAYTERHYGCNFINCSSQQRQETMAHFEKRDQPYAGIAGKVSRKLFGDAFFVTLKKYTILGYCTSEPGATKGMAYDFIPGMYHGHLKLQPGQKCWAT